MTAKDGKHQERCPFWSTTSMKCTICNGGLFIPLDDHAEVYCKTPAFTACIQHTFLSENQIQSPDIVRNSEENRRKHLRVESSHQITLVKILESDRPPPSFASSVSTLDLSIGGMRVVTELPVDHDSMVQFVFDAPFPQSLHEITGQVQWCNKEVDGPGYQVGVSFLEDHIIEAMEQYLGKHHELS